MRTSLPLLAAAALSAVACASPSGGPPAAPPAPASAAPAAPDAGRVSLDLATGASSAVELDARRVAGPGVRLARRRDGAWEGELRGRKVVVAAAGDRLRGDGLDVQVERGAGLVAARGTLFEARVEVDLAPGRVRGTIGPCGLDLADARREGRRYAGELACLGDGRRAVVDATLGLEGAAARPDAPPLPQLVLALLGLLPDHVSVPSREGAQP